MQRKILFKKLLLLFFLWASQNLTAQSSTLKGVVTSEGFGSIEGAEIALEDELYVTATDDYGFFEFTNLPAGTYKIVVYELGFERFETVVELHENETTELDIQLISEDNLLEMAVITGTLKEVLKLDSPVPVEVYTSQFFKANPTPTLFDAMQNINGVRPQVNCNVCNTGDIHINGLEGPYTMVLIDGMPIVSGLSTVYGLFGIPQSLIERVEVVKGPASTLYGSEAVGGLINIITKKPNNAPIFSADVLATTWQEYNVDLASKFEVGKNSQSLLGVNYFNYQNPIDNNGDGFTDVTLQNRISVFNKWNFSRKDHRVFSLAARYIYEDRWGGEMNWKRSNRGGDEVYGESIYTSRWELFGIYQLPFAERMMFQFSLNGHDQNSVYGDVLFLADQKIGFGQLTWEKTFGNHDLLAGFTYRYSYYDDNTPATFLSESSENNANHTHLPGLFLQDEISINEQNKLLLGVRYDYHSIHGNILTPRINYKWNSHDKNNVLRLSFGNGYRVANVFTEDHAALTGSRDLVFISDLKPETSWNGNINFVKRIFPGNGMSLGLDASAFYTYFTNKIIADYETDSNKIIYDNLDGHAVSKGISLNVDLDLRNGLKFLLGGTYMDVYSKEEGVKSRQLFTERFTGVWNVSYSISSLGISMDYTGNIYSPMRLPLLSELDPRSEYSPWWSIQNIQLTKKFNNGLEIYGGVKNLLNWTPAKGNPFIIARAHDPFDQNVIFDENGQAMVTPENPYGLTFDPTFVYAPNQGIRGFLGIRFTLD